MFSNIWLKIYAVIFLAGLASSLLLTPLFRKLAAKTGFMDVPAANHKGHKKSTPLLGGLAMFLYGMRLMGDSLKENSSGTLKLAMEKVTNNPFKAFLLGIFTSSGKLPRPLVK